MNFIKKSLKQIDSEPRDFVGRFWVVIEPTKDSELADICFETSVVGMMRQALGGLDPDDVVGIYKMEIYAKNTAEQLLQRVKGE